MNKFHESEIIIGVTGALCVDGVCALLDFIDPVVTSPAVQSFATWGIGRWRKAKGGTTTFSKEITKYAANLLPWIPTTFLTFVIGVTMHNREASKQVPDTIEATA